MSEQGLGTFIKEIDGVKYYANGIIKQDVTFFLGGNKKK